MRDEIRSVLRRAIHPSTLLLALLVAVLETATGFAAGLASLALQPYFPGVSVLHVALRDFLLPFVLWLPVSAFALAGFFGVLAEPPKPALESVRSFVSAGRRYGRRYLIAILSGTALALLIVLAIGIVLFAAFIAASTGFDYWRYTQGARFAANPLYALTLGGVLFAIAGTITGSVFAYVGPLVVQTDRSAWRLPLASLEFARQQPRRAVPAAVFATILLALPPHLGRSVFDSMRPNPGWLGPPPDVYRAQLIGALAVTLAVATLAAVFARALTGPLLVHVADDYTDTPGSPSSPGFAALRPGRRFAMVAVLLLVVGSGSAGVRLADVHPQNQPEPGIDLTRPPSEIYEASVSLTESVGRRENYSTITRHPNGTFGHRVSWRVAWDPADAQLMLVLGGTENGESGTSAHYMAEGVFARRTVGDYLPGWNPNQFRGLYRVTNGWIVLPLPGYGLSGGTDSIGQIERKHTNDTARLHVTERTPERLVLTANGSDASALSKFSESKTRGLRNATFRVTIDPRTGYLEHLSLRGTLVERNTTGAVIDRSRHNVTATYRDVGETDVTRPAIGPPGPLEVLWDILYY